MNEEDKFAKIMAGVVYHTSGYVSHARNYFNRMRVRLILIL